MANFIKIIFFLVIIAGIGIYSLSNQPEIFQGVPQENIFSPAPRYIAPSAPPSVSSPSAISPPDYLIPPGFTRSQLSPYFGKMRISAQDYNSSYNPSGFRVYAGLSNDEKVNITGWRIKTNRGEIIIPQAINVYEPSGLTPPQDIVLSANNYVNIYLSINPINNKSFRLNKCMGYLQNTYVFNPPLPQNCPAPSRSDISYLSGQCQSYILSLWGCEVPDEDSDSFYTSVGGSSREEVECRAFLDTINQSGCFQKHRWDDDFLSNEWRVWVWQHILDSQHDRVLFFDKQGLLVDQYIY